MVTSVVPGAADQVAEFDWNDILKRRPNCPTQLHQFNEIHPSLACLNLGQVGLWSPQPLCDFELGKTRSFASLANQCDDFNVTLVVN